jgi:23S rRNA (guanosine2251-2'-O)-methyltransferase
MERYRRGKGKQRLLGSHQKCWLWGRNLVAETLEAGRWPVLELFLAGDVLVPERMDRAAALASERSIPCRVEAAADLERLCHSGEHQGYLARMGEYPYATLDGVLSETRGEASLFAALDGLQDPHNLGAVVRSAEVFGVHAVILGASHQVGVTSMAARSSAGAVNRVSISRVEGLVEALQRMREAGIVTVMASEKAESRLGDCDLRRDICIVVGNEGRGVSPDVAACCAERVRIPQCGHIGSLNAAVAASICFYEARRQRSGA